MEILMGQGDLYRSYRKFTMMEMELLTYHLFGGQHVDKIASLCQCESGPVPYDLPARKLRARPGFTACDTCYCRVTAGESDVHSKFPAPAVSLNDGALMCCYEDCSGKPR